MTISPIAPRAVPQNFLDVPGEKHSSSSCQHRDFQKLTFASFASHFLVTAPHGIFLSPPVSLMFSPVSTVAKHFQVAVSGTALMPLKEQYRLSPLVVAKGQHSPLQNLVPCYPHNIPPDSTTQVSPQLHLTVPLMRLSGI